MPTERRSPATFLLCALMLASGHANAFEPGSKTTCQPSADGKDFICDAADGHTPGKKTRTPARTEQTRSEPVPSAAEITPVATAAPAVRTSDLPDYLRHAAEPTVVRQPTRTVPAEPTAAPRPEPAAPAATPNSELFTPPPAAVTHRNAGNAAPVAAPASAPAHRSRRAAEATPDTAAPRSEPASLAPVAAAVVPAVTAPAPQPSAAETPAQAQVATTDRGVPPNGLTSTARFRQLPAQRYTLEVGKARSRVALQAQIDSFASVAEPLYLLQLATPDGDWYVLVLSDFPTAEAARAARSRLPATAAITSGFARRIGPLQAELAR